MIPEAVKINEMIKYWGLECTECADIYKWAELWLLHKGNLIFRARKEESSLNLRSY